MHEKLKDYTLRLMIDFTIQEDKKYKLILLLEVTHLNMILINLVMIMKIIILINVLLMKVILKNIDIRASNNIDLPYSIYRGSTTKNPMPVEFANDFLPNMVEKDIHYKELKENYIKNKKICNTDLRCWDCQSVSNRNPQYCSCNSINKFKLEDHHY